MTLRGTPVLYMGEEIGMPDAPPTARDRSGRDVSRSPMQWDASPSGGFTTGTPWLACGETRACNVADQVGDPASILALYRRLIALRHASPAIGVGAQRQIDLPRDLAAVAFVRSSGDERRLVVVNVGAERLELDLRAASRGRLPGASTLVLGTDPVRPAGEPVSLERTVVAPFEAVVLGV
jgi:alpha-glucosidase